MARLISEWVFSSFVLIISRSFWESLFDCGPFSFLKLALFPFTFTFPISPLLSPGSNLTSCLKSFCPFSPHLFIGRRAPVVMPRPAKRSFSLAEIAFSPFHFILTTSSTVDTVDLMKSGRMITTSSPSLLFEDLTTGLQMPSILYEGKVRLPSPQTRVTLEESPGSKTSSLLFLSLKLTLTIFLSRCFCPSGTNDTEQKGKVWDKIQIQQSWNKTVWKPPKLADIMCGQPPTLGLMWWKNQELNEFYLTHSLAKTLTHLGLNKTE